MQKKKKEFYPNRRESTQSFTRQPIREKRINDVKKVRIKMGADQGAPTSETSEAMKDGILEQRDGRNIINRSESIPQRESVLQLITYSVASLEGRIMRVGTDPMTARRIRGMYHRRRNLPDTPVSRVTTRWMGGRLTNRSTMRNLAMAFKRREKRAPYELASSMQKRYDHHFRSLESWLVPQSSKQSDELPTLIFFFNPSDQRIGLVEARQVGVVTAGRVNTNMPRDLLTYVTYAIPCNTKSLNVQFRMAKLIRDAIVYGMKLREEAKIKVRSKSKSKSKQGQPDRSKKSNTVKTHHRTS
jgi:ribosomal protein S2